MIVIEYNFCALRVFGCCQDRQRYARLHDDDNADFGWNEGFFLLLTSTKQFSAFFPKAIKIM
jgi:hypothetical protein